MALIIKKRVINTDIFPVDNLVRIVSGGKGYNGVIRETASDEVIIVSSGDALSVTTAQLDAKEFDVFLCSIDMIDVVNIMEADATRESERDIFDVTATAPGQFARWTLDGEDYYTGVVDGISESQITINVSGGYAVIRVSTALKPGFLIRFSDNINGEPVRWTVIEQEGENG